MLSLLLVLEPSNSNPDELLVSTINPDLCGPEFDQLVDEVLLSEQDLFGDGSQIWDCDDVMAHPELHDVQFTDPDDMDENLMATEVFWGYVYAELG